MVAPNSDPLPENLFATNRTLHLSIFWSQIRGSYSIDDERLPAIDQYTRENIIDRVLQWKLISKLVQNSTKFGFSYRSL